jgi:2-dehydro-3-deoxygluconokinase
MAEKVVTFGEVMLRLSPPGFQRFVQARSFDAIYGGGEANVAASLAHWGLPVEYVTRLPSNDLGDACLNYLRQYGIGTRHVVRGGERLGIYFLESGAAQRGSKVIYDRGGSALATIEPGMINWRRVFAEAHWFHWTGITPAISESAAKTCLEAIQVAKEMGLAISCDLNYRAKLWKWGKSAREVMPELTGLCDVVVSNEEDADRVFGIQAPQADVLAGRVEAAAYADACRELAKRLPHLRMAAFTLRGSLSASHNTWSAISWTRSGEGPGNQGEICTAPLYDIAAIVDRVGAGDSFCAALIYGLRRYEDAQQALCFAVAASCLKHTIPGDFNLVSIAEVEKLMAGNLSGRVSR